MSPRPSRLFPRKITFFYQCFLISSLIFLGIWSFHIIDHTRSLDKAQYIPPPNEIGLPGFHNHRDPKFGMPVVTTTTSSSSRNEPKSKSDTSTTTGIQSSFWQQPQQQQVPPPPEVRQPKAASTPVKHPTFVDQLKQSRRELEASTLSAAISDRPFSWKPAPSNVSFDQFVLPPPYRPSNDTTVVVLVLSSYQNYERRQSIRETWLNGTVFFVVGQPNCTTATSMADCHKDNHFDILLKEQGLYHDLVEIPMIESYQQLPEKVIQAYHWTLQFISTVQWIIKVDDDTFVRPVSLQRYVQKYNPNTPIWIGKMIPHSPVARSGKWADFEYQPNFYPYWAIGSAGHIVSRSIAQFVVQNSATLHRYQGEDVSLGIWLHQWHETVTYIQAERMITNDGIQVCGIPRYIMIGHDLTLDEMYECHLRFQNISVFQENTWLEQPAGFEEVVRLEESAVFGMMRNVRSTPGDYGDAQFVARGEVSIAGPQPNKDAALAAITAVAPHLANPGDALSKRRAIGYSFPGSLRAHLANKN